MNEGFDSNDAAARAASECATTHRGPAVRFIFMADAHLSPDDAPTLLFRMPSRGEAFMMSGIYTEAIDCKDFDRRAAIQLAAAKFLLVGWENMRNRAGQDMQFDPEKLEDVLSIGDLGEIQSRLGHMLRDYYIRRNGSAGQRK